MVKKVWEGMLCNHNDHKILTLMHMYIHMLDTVLYCTVLLHMLVYTLLLCSPYCLIYVCVLRSLH